MFNYQVYRTHGLIYVYAKDNDSFDQIARSMGFKAKQLMKFNEVPEDFPLQEGDIVYLEKKKKKAEEKEDKAVGYDKSEQKSLDRLIETIE